MTCLLCGDTHALLPEAAVSRSQSLPACHAVGLAALYYASSADSAVGKAITPEYGCVAGSVSCTLETLSKVSFWLVWLDQEPMNSLEGTCECVSMSDAAGINTICAFPAGAVLHLDRAGATASQHHGRDQD